MAKQVIAYESFNGKLFPTLEKCEAYEKKMRAYPRTKTTTKQAEPSFDGEQFPIYKIITENWETPSKPKRVDITYKVIGKNGVYMIPSTNGMDFILMHPEMKTSNTCEFLTQEVAKRLINGDDKWDSEIWQDTLQNDVYNFLLESGKKVEKTIEKYRIQSNPYELECICQNNTLTIGFAKSYLEIGYTFKLQVTKVC